MGPIEQLKNEYDSIEKYLTENKEISLLSDLNKNFRKILLLAAGSFFEKEIMDILTKYIEKVTNKNELMINFLNRQALKGKYFQLFDWGEQDEPEKFKKNANQFWKLFGDNFKTKINEEIKANEQISDSISAFIQIGHLRNILVHSNLAEYNYEQMTTDEIYKLFQSAERFINYLKKKFE